MQVFVLDREPEAARSMLAGAGSDPAGQGPSRGLPAISLHDHPQGSGRRGIARPRAPDQDRSRLQDDRRCHRPGDDGPGRCRGRDRAPGAGDQGVAQGPGGDPSRGAGRGKRATASHGSTTGRDGRVGSRRRLESRVANVLTWVARLCRLCPITAASQELVRFDLQKEQNPEIAGIEYQQGTLAGYETAGVSAREVRPHVRVLRQDGRAAPGRAHRPAEQGRDRPRLEPHPGVRGVQPTQGEPAGRGVPEAGARDPGAVIKRQPRGRSRTPRRSTRPGGSCTDGSRRPACRSRRARAAGLSSTARCAACPRRTGWTRHASGPAPRNTSVSWVSGRCWSRRAGMASGTDVGRIKHGFPIRHAPAGEDVPWIRTGDLVRAVIPSGKHRGTHAGRITIRNRPSFRLGTIDVHPDRLTVVHRADGYAYSFGETLFHVESTTG